MYEQGSLIMYGSTGVCRVEDVAPMNGSRGADRNRLYYKLVPVYGTGTIYVPVDTKLFMRPILSYDEALSLIRRIPAIRELEDENSKDWHALTAAYRERIHSHDCEELVSLIKAVYFKMHAAAEGSKRPHKVDQDFRKRAEELLHSELAAALGITPEEVPDYIAAELDKS